MQAIMMSCTKCCSLLRILMFKLCSELSLAMSHHVSSYIACLALAQACMKQYSPSSRTQSIIVPESQARSKTDKLIHQHQNCGYGLLTNDLPQALHSYNLLSYLCRLCAMHQQKHKIQQAWYLGFAKQSKHYASSWSNSSIRCTCFNSCICLICQTFRWQTVQSPDG